MFFDFIFICLIVWSIIIYILREKDKKRIKSYSMSESELEFCKNAFDAEMKNSGYGLDKYELSDSAKRYQNWLQRYNDVNPQYDCIVITIGLLISATFFWFIFYDASIDNAGGFIFKMIVFLFADMILGAVFGEGSALLVEQFYKKRHKDIRYWSTCVLCSLSFVLLAIIFFIYYDPEFDN